MALSDFFLDTQEIIFGKNKLQIRGLSFIDIALLIAKHKDAIEQLIGVFKKGDAETNIVSTLLTELPELASHVIACACDEPECADKARKLPLPVQLDALMAVGRLTFEEAGGVKKFAEQLADLFKSARMVLPNQAP